MQLKSSSEVISLLRILISMVSLMPTDPVINDHLGDAYWQVGRKREAIFQWKRSLSLEPNEDLLISLNKKLLSGLGKIPTSKEKLLNDT